MMATKKEPEFESEGLSSLWRTLTRTVKRWFTSDPPLRETATPLKPSELAKKPNFNDELDAPNCPDVRGARHRKTNERSCP